MYIHIGHIFHSVVYGDGCAKALMTLYNNHRLSGDIGYTGILLVRKIKNRVMLDENDMCNARMVVKHHAKELVELSRIGTFTL